jgi:nitrogen-specific signal transduction histidine kinase
MTKATCLLYSTDAAWGERVARSLPEHIAVRTFAARLPLEGALERMSMQVLLADLRGPQTPALLQHIHIRWPAAVILAFGTPGSDPVRAAEELNLFAVEDLDTDRARLGALVHRALAYVQLQQESRMLRMELERVTHEFALAKAGAALPEAREGVASTRHFPFSLHKFDDVDAMLESLAEGVADTLLVGRVGIFCRSRDSENFSLRAGLRCLDDARQLTYEPDDALVRWLERNAHMVYRPHLDHVAAADERLLLLQTLDVFGAELIIPLNTHERLLGWMFIGHRATGLPFERPQLERLMLIAEQVSTTLENAILYEELTVQKTLAETLLQSLPVGIVAVDAEGVVRWYSTAAATILGIPAADAMQRPIEHLGSRLADAVRRSLQGEPPPAPPLMWTDAHTKRTIAVLALRLTNAELCLGSVALLQDMTAQMALKAKEEQLERTVFWAELAASLSHEISNPLVTIQTFAQLLPERYQEEEFRCDFSRLVSLEVQRLNSIITQIYEFAHPPNLANSAVEVLPLINASVDKVLPVAARGSLKVTVQVDPQTPAIWGDQRALADALGYLLTNAREALEGRAEASIVVSARTAHGTGSEPVTELVVSDNGPGIPTALRDRVFSPFCTIKPRGLGLGLSIVKRTVTDHGGRVHLETGASGTSITLLLPAAARDRLAKASAVEATIGPATSA